MSNNGNEPKVGMPSIEELKGICFKCRKAVVFEADQVIRRQIPHPLNPSQPVIEEAHLRFFQAFCAARGGKVSMNPECVILKCTDFVQIEGVLPFAAPADADKQEPSRLVV
jgi:hypothetical protein